MSKHTPGPWFVVNDAIYRRQKKDLYQYGGSVAGDMPLATISRGWFGDSDGYPVVANAHLIAAAPDLLSVCQRIFEADPYDYDVPLGLWDDLKAVIAKAEGRS